MRIRVFYKSNEGSNSICSATKSQLLKSKFKDLINIDFINLDKRNLAKYLEKEQNIDTLYFWYNEKDGIKYVEENHPNIKVVTYDSSVKEFKMGLYGDSFKYALADKIINQYKESTGLITLYEYKTDTHTVEKIKITKCDYEIYKNTKNYFLLKKSAQEYAKKDILEDIKSIEESIERQNKRLKEYKSYLNKLENK